MLYVVLTTSNEYLSPSLQTAHCGEGYYKNACNDAQLFHQRVHFIRLTVLLQECGDDLTFSGYPYRQVKEKIDEYL